MSTFVARFSLGVSMIFGALLSDAAAQTPEPTVIVIQETSTASPTQPTVTSASPAYHGIRLAPWPFGRSGRLGDGQAKERLSQCGYCCKSHIDWYGCNTLRTELTFIFGSCRTFFGEPCEPSDPIRHSRGAGYPNDYRQGNGNGGCAFCK